MFSSNMLCEHIKYMEEDAIDELFGQGPMERVVSGALRQCIHSHGPITGRWNGSATKRVANALKGYFLQYSSQTFNNELIERHEKDFEEEKRQLRRSVKSLRKQRDDLLKKLKDGKTL